MGVRVSEGIRTPNSGATSRCLNHLATPAASVRIYQFVSQLTGCRAPSFSDKFPWRRHWRLLPRSELLWVWW